MMTATLTAFCYGIAFTGAVGAGLFFFRFWRLSGDGFFLYFGAAFVLLAAQWLALVVVNPEAESRPYYYLLRLVAFVLIIIATVQKNRGAPVTRDSRAGPP